MYNGSMQEAIKAAFPEVSFAKWRWSLKTQRNEFCYLFLFIYKFTQLSSFILFISLAYGLILFLFHNDVLRTHTHRTTSRVRAISHLGYQLVHSYGLLYIRHPRLFLLRWLAAESVHLQLQLLLLFLGCILQYDQILITNQCNHVLHYCVYASVSEWVSVCVCVSVWVSECVLCVVCVGRKAYLLISSSLRVDLVR